MPVHLFGRPAALAELAALGVPIVEDAAQAFGAAGDCDHRRRLHLQLLPDEEPVRARRRRPRRGDRRGARRPRADAALPRLARQDRLPGDRLQLAPRRAPGGRPAAVPAEAAGLERVPARGRRPLPRARARRALHGSARRAGPRLPHVRRPHARARPARSRPAGGGDLLRRRTTSRRSTFSRRCASSATGRVRSPRPSGRRARTSRCRCGRGSMRRPRSGSWRRSARPPRWGRRSDLAADHEAPPLAARRRRRALRSRLVPRVPAPLRPADPAVLPHDVHRTIWIVILDPAGRLRPLRLLQPLVALRLDARHVGRRARRHGRLPRLRASSSTSPTRCTRCGCRARSRSWTGCSCSRSSPARGCSRGR